MMRSRKALWLTVLCSTVLASPAMAQEDVTAAIAELRAENAKLAARIAELEQERDARRSAPAAVASTAAKQDIEGPRQTTPTQITSQPADDAPAPATRAVVTAIPPAPLERPVQGGGVGMQISAGSGGGQVSVAIGRSIRATDVRGDQVKAVGTGWTITAAAPIDKKGGDTSIGSLDSFTDSSSLRLALTRLHLTLPNLLTDRDYLELIGEATSACIAVAAADATKSLACQEADVDEEFIRTWLPAKLRQYVALMTQQRSAWGYGLEGTIGFRSYSFVDPVGVNKSSVDKLPWGVKGYLTWLPRTAIALTASAAYQRGYDENKATIVCPAPVIGTPTVCLTGPNGRPVRKDKVLLALEGRRIFDLSLTQLQNGLIDRFGIAPQITWDANNNDVGVDFPLYLVPDDKGNLIGGIRVGYTSGEDGFNAGVFVGTAFDLFKR